MPPNCTLPPISISFVIKPTLSPVYVMDQFYADQAPNLFAEGYVQVCVCHTGNLHIKEVIRPERQQWARVLSPRCHQATTKRLLPCAPYWFSVDKC